jgi:hypothetical protein
MSLRPLPEIHLFNECLLVFVRHFKVELLAVKDMGRRLKQELTTWRIHPPKKRVGLGGPGRKGAGREFADFEKLWRAWSDPKNIAALLKRHEKVASSRGLVDDAEVPEVGALVSI